MTAGRIAHRTGEADRVDRSITGSAVRHGITVALFHPLPVGKTAVGVSRSAERAAENESIFRDANERIEDRLGELTVEDGRSPFLCECEDTSCREVLRLTKQEYEDVRADPRRFILSPGHPFTHAQVIEHHDRYLVVEKMGEAGEIAEERDPRS